MSTAPRQPAPAGAAIDPAALAIRTGITGALVAAMLGGALWIALPAALLERGGTVFILAGAATGAVTGMIGNALISFGSSRPAEDPTNSTGFLRAVVLDFAVQVFAVAGGMVGLFLNDVKFQPLAAFGITFAVVATASRITGTVLVSRALLSRARSRARRADAEPLVQDSHS